MTLAEVAELIHAAAAGPPAAADCGEHFSIREHFSRDCVVLLTGATGYIGSLTLEKLLRSTEVGRIYVLVRARRGQNPQERLARILRGPLFHLLAKEQLERVSAVAGDIMQPGLGLSPQDEAMLEAEVDTVLHSAADIRLDAPIHDTLTANYVGTLSMMRLAARMPRLRSFTYISTCYTNINRPRGTLVEEKLYPLIIGGKEVDVSGLAEELLALPAEVAAERAASFIELWGFRNTYAFGKHLTEKALAALNREQDLPLAIVRPSLVSAISADPYPGYCGNYAGPVGSAAAYLTGLYDDQPEAVACDATSIWDLVPGDTAVHAIIAAAAAVAHAHTRLALTAPAPPRVAAPAYVSGSPVGTPTAASSASHSGSVDAHIDLDRDHPSPVRVPKHHHHAGTSSPAPSAATSEGRVPGAPLIVQIATSCTYPQTTSQLFNSTVMFVAAHRRPFTLATGRIRGMAPNMAFDKEECERLKGVAARKVRPLVWMLKKMGGKGGKKAASQLSVGMKSFITLNTKKYDLHLFFGTATLMRLEASLSPAERDDFSIVWRPPAAEVPKVLALLQGYSDTGSPLTTPKPCRSSTNRWDSDSDACAADVTTSPRPVIKADAAESELSAGSDGAAAPAFSSQEALRRAREGGWALFHNNVYAFLYKNLYGREVPKDSKVPRRRIKAALPFLGAEEEVEAARRVVHSFTPVRAH